MKKADVHIGHTYRAKVSGRLTAVRITGASPYGGWDAVNVETRRRVRIKSAQRLRADLTAAQTPDGGTEMAKAKKTSAKAKAKKASSKGAKAKASAAGKACPKCGGPLEVVDADHKAGKVVYGCPKCDGSKFEMKRDKQRKQTTEKVDLLKRAREAREAKAAARKARAKERAERLGLAEKPRAKRARGKMSGLDAAAKVLAETGNAMTCKAIVQAAFEKGYWQSDGATPHATIYAAILREIQTKGEKTRFKKAGPGLFALAK